MKEMTAEQYRLWKIKHVRWYVKERMEYKDEWGKTLGDVDLFMYPLKSDADMMIFEFKRQNKPNGRLTARGQLQRFRDYIQAFYSHKVRSSYGYFRTPEDEQLNILTCEEWDIKAHKDDIMYR